MATTAAGEADFAALFDQHHGEALRLAYQLCGDWHRAEDVAAEAFARCYRHWRDGGIQHPRAYLRRAVVNEVNSRFRRLAIERREAVARAAETPAWVAPDDQYADHELLDRVLRQLPPRQRATVVLRYYADLPERDTAKALGVSVGAVKSSTSRGLKRLQGLLADEAA